MPTRPDPYGDLLDFGVSAAPRARGSTAAARPYDDLLDERPVTHAAARPGIVRRAAGAVADFAETVGEYIPSPIKAALQTPGAAVGLLGLAGDPDAYWRAYDQQADAIDKDAEWFSTSEQIRSAPGLGSVLRESLSPREPGARGWGEAAKNVGALAVDIATDPSTYLGGGLRRAGKLAKLAATGERAADIASDVGRGRAAIEAAARTVGSPVAGAVYAPEIVQGVGRGIESGDYAQAALTGGLGALMGYGIRQELKELRGQPSAIEQAAAKLEDAEAPPQAPPLWTRDRPAGFDAPDMGVRREPTEVLADQMRLRGLPELWDRTPEGLPDAWEEPIPPEFQTAAPPRAEPISPEVYPGQAIEPQPLPEIRTPAEVAADIAAMRGPDLEMQALADEALLARVQAEKGLPVTARIPEWEGEAADASRMAREVAQQQTAVPPDPRAVTREPGAPVLGRDALEVDTAPQEITPVPRGEERRHVVEPTPSDRRHAERRARIAQELSLPPEHVAVGRLHASEVEARTDPLTGLGNKRAWEEIQSTLGDSDRVVMVDMKKFKPINDRFGHAAGDVVLRKMGTIVREVLGDESARFGGDEFGAIVRDASPERLDVLEQEVLRRASDNPTTLRNPKTGETLDIPGFEVHIARGANAEAADIAVNEVAAASRAGGRGDVALPGDANLDRAEPATPGPARSGLGDRPAELTPPQYKTGTDAPRPALTLDDVRRYVPNRKVTQAQDGAFEFGVSLPRGELRVRLEPTGEIALDPAAFRKGRPDQSPEGQRVLGSFHRVDDLATIKLLAKEGKGPSPETVHHELYHLAEEAVLTPREIEIVGKRWGNTEQRAEAYAKWTPNTPHTFFGKIRAFFRRIWRSFRPDAETVFGRVRSGEAFGREARRATTRAPELATGDRPPVLAAAIGAAPVHSLDITPAMRDSIAEEGFPQFATAPAEPPGMPAPKVGPVAVPDAPKPEPMGRPMEPGEAPRVEAKVEQLEAVAPGVHLSRDAPRTWESLDKPIRARLADALSSPEKESAFYERARSGKLNDVDVQALDALVAGKREKYDAARQALLTAENEGAAGVEYLRAALDQATAGLAKAARSDVEAGTKLARALAARARVMNAAVSADSPDAMLRLILREIPDVSDAQAAELLKVYRERPGDMADAIQAAMQPKRLNQWIEAWKNGLVSAPGSWLVANPLSNVAEQVLRVGETALAAAIDPVLGGGRTRLGGEARFEVAGALRGAGKAAGQLARDLRDIVTLAPERIDLSSGAFERQTGAIPGRLGRAVRIPYRLLGAFDAFTRGVGGEAELHKLAFRRAGGDKAKAAALIADPPLDMLKAMRASQLSRTFQDPNRLADSIARMRADHRWLHVVMPFVQTPANIASMTIQRSPVGFLTEALPAYRAYRAAVRKGADAETLARLKGEAVDKLARPMVGTLIMGTFAAVAQAGGMTGSGPEDPGDRNALRDTGWQPYSFVITDPTTGRKAYIPFGRFEPVSSLLGFAADIIEAKEAKTAQSLFEKALTSATQNLTSKTYLQGLADAAELINDPNVASKYLSGLAGSVVPNVVAKAAQAIDPAMRDTRPDTSGIGGLPKQAARTIASRVPGLSTTLPERKSGTGAPIERQGNAVTRLLSPVQGSREKEGAEFERTLVEIDAVPSAPKRDVSVKGHRVRFTDEEYAAIQAADAETSKRLRKTVLSTGFRRLDPEEQRRIVENAYSRGRADARNRVMRSGAFWRRASEERRGAPASK